jgi:hypothetical protein
MRSNKKAGQLRRFVKNNERIISGRDVSGKRRLPSRLPRACVRVRFAGQLAVLSLSKKLVFPGTLPMAFGLHALPLVVNLLGSYAHGEVECSAVVGLPDSDPTLSHGIACDRAGSIPPVGAFEFEV